MLRKLGCAYNGNDPQQIGNIMHIYIHVSTYDNVTSRKGKYFIILLKGIATQNQFPFNNFLSIEFQ